MAKDAERRAELTEHLAELRTRLIRSIIYTIAGAIVAWIFYDWLFALVLGPMNSVLKDIDAQFLLTTIQEGFVIRMQVSLIAGLILALPLVTLEVWGFVAPGLTPAEKKPLKWVVPLSVFLFACGVALCYAILPMGFSWFVNYVPEGAVLKPKVQDSILFTLKMLLAFGVVFELPVFLMMLAKVGLVDSKMLKDNWRYAIVAVSVVAAVATPSNDALTMLMMGVPVALLYFASIVLVRVVEGKPRIR